MQLFKKLRGLPNLKRWGSRTSRSILLLVLSTGNASAESCLAPVRPFVPNDAQAARDYADFIKRDFELYIRDIQSYFRCLEGERARAFEEAREVSEEYGRFLQTIDQ